MARHLDVADAVVAAIDGHTFSQSLTVSRKVLPLKKLEGLDTVHVVVIPSTFSTETADRTRRATSYGIDIGIQKQIDPDSLAAFDAMFELFEETVSLFSMKRLDGLQAATWLGAETVPGAEAGYAWEDLATKHLFTSILRITWKVIEAS
jgi:hypothetical protein